MNHRTRRAPQCALTVLALSLSAGLAQAATPCLDLAGVSIDASVFTLATTGAILTSAEIVPATVPGPTAVGEYCKVRGAIHPVDPDAPDILFQVNLPTGWNEKALHMGGGGYNGTVIAGTGNLWAPPLNQPVPLGRGYATFGSDSGHEAAAPYLSARTLDARFGVNDEALRNFAGDALKKTLDAALHVIGLHYDQAPAKTYFAGGSTGGREAMAVTQRWPESYDGAIALFPAWNAASLDLQFGRIARAMAPKDNLGNPIAYPNDAKKKLLYDAVMTACDQLDGLKDGVISHVAACKFNPQTLRCPGGADTGDTCLSDPQISALKVYDSAIKFGYEVASGETGYPGFNIFAGADTRGLFQLATEAPATTETPHLLTMPYLFNFWDGWVKYFVTGDKTFDSLSFDPFDPANPYAAANQKRISELTALQDVNSTDLTAFASRGGKLLLAHGTADGLVSTRATEDYYERLLTRYGEEGTRAFVRFYEMPGFGHAIFGAFMPAWDSLTALENWVEQGKAPHKQIITDTIATNAGRTRPLCEFPKWPKYKGNGDPNSAASFTCVNAHGFPAHDKEEEAED